MLAVVVLLAIAMLLACNSTYSASSDGLVIVPSFGSAAVQAFSFNLTNGHASAVNTGPPILGQPTAMVLDPSGNYAYVAVMPNAQVFNTLTSTSIVTYTINSDGTLAATGTPVAMLTLPGGAISPVAMKIDSAGQFLFVADQQATDSNGNTVPGSISVFSIGSGGTLTEVTGSPFTVPVLQVGPTTIANLTGLAVTPTKYPTLNLSLIHI